MHKHMGKSIDDLSEPVVPEKILGGIPLSDGIAFGKPLFLEAIATDIEEVTIEKGEVEGEVRRYQTALHRTRSDLERLEGADVAAQNTQVAHIVQAHLEMLKDPMLTTQVVDTIRKKQKNAEAVMQGIISEWTSHANFIKDDFFRERAKDIEFLSHRVLGNLREHLHRSLEELDDPRIVIAGEIASTDALEATPGIVAAFVTHDGAPTSHAAIIAKAKAIAYVSGIPLTLESLAGVERMIVDGTSGTVILNPTVATMDRYVEKRQAEMRKKAAWLKTRTSRPSMSDGTPIPLMANIGQTGEAEEAFSRGAEGIGLVRSEYLLLGEGHLDDEEGQFELYQKIARACQDYPATIRTLDIAQEDLARRVGEERPEMPALYRGLRWLLKNDAIFREHLRAILRASAYGKLKVMFPMVTDIAEFDQAAALVREVKDELRKEHIQFNEEIQIGCMIENPAAAVVSDAFAEKADFFSIGTNDLTQFCIATDRRTQINNDLFSPMHPVVVRLIDRIVRAGHAAGIEVCACGDAAANPRYTALFLGLGIDSLSMPISQFDEIKHVLAHIDREYAAALAEKALQISSGGEMARFLSKAYEKVMAKSELESDVIPTES
jgi:phosphotransferase system enzyme I (PtsI)